jgi:hypothetical protein
MDDNAIAQDSQKKVAADPPTEGALAMVDSRQGKVTLKEKAKSDVDGQSYYVSPKPLAPLKLQSEIEDKSAEARLDGKEVPYAATVT